MHIVAVIFGLSLPIFLVSFAMLAPLIYAWQQPLLRNAFLFPAISGLFLGLFFFLFFWKRVRNSKRNLGVREGVFLVALSWLMSALLAALPLYLSQELPNFYDAFFEAVSGFTTTGATVIEDLSKVDASIILWRAITHWLGGMGIVMLSVAIAPLLRFGSLQLMRAEAPGLELDRLSFRIANTAVIFWSLYLLLTIIQIALLKIFGMSFFDAVIHAFATLATGGFSSQNSSIAAFNSAAIEWTIAVFMLLAGTNFVVYVQLLRGRFSQVWGNSELRFYLLLTLLATLVIVVSLQRSQLGFFTDNLRIAFFQVTSILTTTGFASFDYETWPQAAQYMLFILMFVGGCAGSTGGGIKVVRILIGIRVAFKTIKNSFNQRSYQSLTLNNQLVNEQTTAKVLGFIMLYLILLLLTGLIVSFFAGSDLLTSLSAALATLGNIGPGFSLIGPSDNYAFFPNIVKLWLSLMMLVGRLEIFTLLLLFLPRFWQRF